MMYFSKFNPDLCYLVLHPFRYSFVSSPSLLNLFFFQFIFRLCHFPTFPFKRRPRPIPVLPSSIRSCHWDPASQKAKAQPGCLRKTVLRSRHRETSSGLPWDQHTSGRPTAGNHLVSLQLPEDSRQLPDKKAQAVCLPRIPIPHTRKSLALRDHFWEFQKIPE